MKNTIRLLRVPFSFFLMPVFLFAVSQSGTVNWLKAGFLFVIFHLLIYPASNAYNSYMDRDETSIGGLKNPPQATRQLFYVSVVMDGLGLLLACYVGIYALLGIGLYILASRLYSYRGVRLKKYPVTGFLAVVFFQGGFTFFICQREIGDGQISWLAAMAASFLIAGIYPLTQVYQHKADAGDGVRTISMLLGYRGTFLFTMVMFTIASILLGCYFYMQNRFAHFGIFTMFLVPTITYFLYWMRLVWQDIANADFDHTMRMNALASLCMNACFMMLICLNQHVWQG